MRNDRARGLNTALIEPSPYRHLSLEAKAAANHQRGSRKCLAHADGPLQARRSEMAVPFDQMPGVIWFDGKLIPSPDAKIHVLTHGLHYASAVFEGERAY